jgi:hypothetical protein
MTDRPSTFERAAALPRIPAEVVALQRFSAPCQERSFVGASTTYAGISSRKLSGQLLGMMRANRAKPAALLNDAGKKTCTIACVLSIILCQGRESLIDMTIEAVTNAAATKRNGPW